MLLFPTMLVLLGWALAVFSWLSEEGLPQTGPDRWLASRLGLDAMSREARRGIDITLSLLIMFTGMVAAAA